MYITYKNNYEEYSVLSVSRLSKGYKYFQMKIWVIAQENFLVCRKHAQDGGGSGGGVVSFFKSFF